MQPEKVSMPGPCQRAPFSSFVLRLEDVDFDKINFITIVDKNRKRVVTYLKVVDNSILMIKVRKVLSNKQTSENEGINLK